MKTFDRIATRDFNCMLCHELIVKGERYVDQEFVEHIDGATVITHIRKHQWHDKKCNEIRLLSDMPVAFNGDKEWLVGKAPGKLLTQDWDRAKYHWRDYVYGVDGNVICPGDVIV